MKREMISEAVGNISTRHIEEAGTYVPDEKSRFWLKKMSGKIIAAAVLAVCLLIAGVGVLLWPDKAAVHVYAQGTDEEITGAGAVIHTGTIRDSGEMQGHPLMFYLSGAHIESVRFSCKNQQICFMDWTEMREEYGLARNFTVPYGEEESEYYYLVIDWVPNDTIRELTDNADSTIQTLPDELREDLIVMEITFANGKTAVKAITVSLLDDGTFFASFDDYKISASDTFIKRADSAAISRDILYAQGAIPEEDDIDPAAEEAAKAYYSETVFEVVSIEPESFTEHEAVFSVCVKKGGVIQEPNRTITLQLEDGKWQVVNEGY